MGSAIRFDMQAGWYGSKQQAAFSSKPMPQRLAAAQAALAEDSLPEQMWEQLQPFLNSQQLVILPHTVLDSASAPVQGARVSATGFLAQLLRQHHPGWNQPHEPPCQQCAVLQAHQTQRHAALLASHAGHKQRCSGSGPPLQRPGSWVVIPQSSKRHTKTSRVTLPTQAPHCQLACQPLDQCQVRSGGFGSRASGCKYMPHLAPPRVVVSAADT